MRVLVLGFCFIAAAHAQLNLLHDLTQPIRHGLDNVEGISSGLRGIATGLLDNRIRPYGGHGDPTNNFNNGYPNGGYPSGLDDRIRPYGDRSGYGGPNGNFNNGYYPNDIKSRLGGNENALPITQNQPSVEGSGVSNAVARQARNAEYGTQGYGNSGYLNKGTVAQYNKGGVVDVYDVKTHSHHSQNIDSGISSGYVNGAYSSNGYSKYGTGYPNHGRNLGNFRI